MAPRRRLIDKIEPTPQRKQMKVICPGAARSGSSSLGQALKQLGYNTFAGMAHNFFVDNRFPLWQEAIECKYYAKGLPYTSLDFDKFLGPYEALCGWPAAIFAEELIKAYPDAKVVLTVRDPDEWVESYFESVVKSQKWWCKWNWILPLVGGKIAEFRYMANAAFGAWSYGNPWDKAEMRRFYLDQTQQIRALVPKERLIELQPGGGWESLCTSTLR